jgi:peptidoglycan/LPS O-acetylase OafA/YrhL
MKIGILSYSIYIWQQLFTMTKSEPTWDKLPWYSFPVNIIVLFLVSYFSYNYFEKFFLGLKKRFK